MIGAVGLFKKPSDMMTAGFVRPGDVVAVLGPRGKGALGGSEWLTRKAGRLCGEPPSIDLVAEAKLQEALLAMARTKLLSSAHDCSDGGIAIALAECVIACGVGAHVSIAGTVGELSGEDPTRVVVSYGAAQGELVKRVAAQHSVPIVEIGNVRGAALIIDGVLELSVAELRERHGKALDSVIGTPGG